MPLSMNRWKDQVAVITGASTGIGAVTAEKLVEEGLQVVGLARRAERVEELSKKLQRKKGKLHALKVDMTKEDEILKAFQWVTENLGPVHILINNAGVIQPTDLIDGDTEKWKKILDTNVLGLCIATREAVKIMRDNNIDGHIIHISSVAGHRIPILPQMNVYPASKHAVRALTETLRQELNRIDSKIKITSISPGAVKTEIAQTSNFCLTEANKKAFDEMPVLESEDVADSILYVLSTPPHVQVHELMIKPIGETCQ